MLIEHPRGNYRFLKGSGPYSSGVAASPGYEIVHATFQPMPPLDAGFTRIASHLHAEGRPLHALCGMELRIPCPLPIEDFIAFNEPYIERLKQWDLHIGGMNPVARTNVALAGQPVPEPCVYGFSYTVPSSFRGPTFLTAGAGEMRSGRLELSEVVRLGERSPDAVREKVTHVLGIMSHRLKGLGVSWSDVNATHIYTALDIHPLMEKAILPALQAAQRCGVRWHYSRPPIVELDYEMDVKGVRLDRMVPG